MSKSNSKPRSQASTNASALEHIKLLAASAAKLIKEKRFAILSVIALAYILIAPALIVAHGVKLGLLYLMPDGEAKSGRAGSVVYMRNGNRRNFKVPSLVQNAFTANVRNRFGSLSSAFRSLTQSEQDSWNNAVGYTRTNRFGQTTILKGKALFNRLFQNAINVGFTPPSTCPVPIAVTSCINPSANYSLAAAKMFIDSDSGNVPTDMPIIVFATAAQGNGINRPGKSKYKQIAVLASGAAFPNDVLAKYLIRFGQPALNDKLFFRLTSIASATGQAGADQIVSCVVTA